ncbi:germination protein YpeB [Paraliobacillus quinghaiensis]|uniref:Germination protein YpeB n=1 Tax=Paraliobacillus quinghaiensis TaxID=470815 RepID=A0A917WRB7_9BACI|nr:germination protein YpeB [Paraliobacillus quinghaiensis]GGM22753.1 germination protein YpeB [Paraliobacillus quinghaiensis]
MIRWISIVILAIAIFATGAWGYQEHQEKNAILVQAENNYQRAFHDLTYQVDLLHDKIGTTLAMNTKEKLSPQLIEIWRLTSEAQTDVGQLPLVLLPFNKTEEFLSNIGEFSYRTAVRDLEQEPLSDKEVDTLNNLYKKAGDIKNELRKVQHVVLEDNLRWMDVQMALVSTDEPMDNTIIDGFETVEETVKAYEESDLSSGLTGISNETHEFRFIKGENISESQAEEQIRKLFKLDDELELTIAESGDGAQLPMYSASFQNEKEHGYIDISKQGGHPLSFMLNREINEKNLSLNDALLRAEKFLKANGFSDMVMFQSNQYENVGVFQFLYQQGDVRVYPDKIQMKVALDDGEILGFVATDFYRNHENTEYEEPSLALEEAKERVNPTVTIQDQHLAIVEDDFKERILAYAFLGTKGQDTYRIFIDANTGQEIKVEKLKAVETKWNID